MFVTLLIEGPQNYNFFSALDNFLFFLMISTGNLVKKSCYATPSD